MSPEARIARAALAAAWLAGASVLAAAGSAAAAPEWGFDAAAGVAYDDNLSNGYSDEEREADTAGVVELGGTARTHLGDSTGLDAGLVAKYAYYVEHSGLTSLGLGARVQVRRKFGLGWQAPWIAASARAVHYDYRYDDRDGWQYEAGVAAGKKLSERWAVQGSARYDAYAADSLRPGVLPGVSTAAYDVSGVSLGAQASLLLSERDVLAFAYTWRDGSVTSVVRADYAVLMRSEAAVRDTVFGGPARIAYRVEAKTDTVAVTWSRLLGPRTALNLAYGYRSARAARGLGDYYAHLLSLTVGYAY